MITNKVLNKSIEYKEDNLGLFNKIDSNTGISFAESLAGAMQKVNELENISNDYSIKLASGELENIHEAMIASQKAEIASQFLMGIRNKVLDAYREIMRMQI